LRILKIVKLLQLIVLDIAKLAVEYSMCTEKFTPIHTKKVIIEHKFNGYFLTLIILFLIVHKGTKWL